MLQSYYIHLHIMLLGTCSDAHGHATHESHVAPSNAVAYSYAAAMIIWVIPLLDIANLLLLRLYLILLGASELIAGLPFPKGFSYALFDQAE